MSNHKFEIDDIGLYMLGKNGVKMMYVREGKIQHLANNIYTDGKEKFSVDENGVVTVLND